MPTTRNQNKALGAGPVLTQGHAAKCSRLGKAGPANTQHVKQQHKLQQHHEQQKPASGVKRKASCDLPPRPKKQKGTSVTFADECSALESQCLEPAPLPQLKCKVRAADNAELDIRSTQADTPVQHKAPAEPKTPATADRHRRLSGADLQRCDSEAGPSASDERWFDPRDPQKVNRVKSVLHTSHTPPGGRPLSREEQVQSLSDHLRACLLAGEGGSLYVSGLPGTGKTLTVHAVVRACCQDMAKGAEAAPVSLSINCMTLASPQAVFARLLDGVQAAAQLPLKPQPDDSDPFIQPGGGTSCVGDSNAGVLRELKAALGVTQKDASTEADRRQSMSGRRSSVSGRRGRRMIVAVLDEMDQLISQDQSILYELFTLATLKGCRLVLVGIANSIDLTARVLPRLQSLARKPQLVTFPSYSAPQLEALLHQRLTSLPGPVFHPQAIRLVAKKTASRSGDMRQVLDACAAAVDILVQEAAEAGAAATPGDEGADADAALFAQKPLARVGINPMFKVISQLQGGGSAAVLAVKGLPPQQQLLLCAAANLIGDAAGSETPLKGTPSRRLSGFGCATPMSAGNKRRLSFGFSEGVGTPGRINMSRRLSTASDASTGSGLLPRKHDCILGELHSAYEDLCKKVAFKPLASSEVSAACSTLADMGLLGLGHAREERQRRVTLRMAVADITLALADARLLRSCLTYDPEISA